MISPLGGVFTITNTADVNGMAWFSLQLGDWMLGDSITVGNIDISPDNRIKSIRVLSDIKPWFAEYQVYQEFNHVFASPQNFAISEFIIVISDGLNVNNGRTNIGQFVAHDQE